jgi:putative Mg2+ transporter-C (MgtC) family protein
MAEMSFELLRHYWGGDILFANAFIGLNLVGALLLGMLVGYERSYQGRAAGMRTYGLVCMASTALTVFVGFVPMWYGGAAPQIAGDPTRVVQDVVTGIGFLCAGVIIKDGRSIRGLTTAASIWAVSAIGVLLGVGFYAAALLLALLSTLSMSSLHRRQPYDHLCEQPTAVAIRRRGARAVPCGIPCATRQGAGGQ